MIGKQIYISYAFLFGEYLGWKISGLEPLKFISLFSKHHFSARSFQCLVQSLDFWILPLLSVLSILFLFVLLKNQQVYFAAIIKGAYVLLLVLLL